MGIISTKPTALLLSDNIIYPLLISEAGMKINIKQIGHMYWSKKLIITVSLPYKSGRVFLDVHLHAGDVQEIGIIKKSSQQYSDYKIVRTLTPYLSGKTFRKRLKTHLVASHLNFLLPYLR